MQIVGGHIGQKPSQPYRLSFNALSCSFETQIHEDNNLHASKMFFNK